MDNSRYDTIVTIGGKEYPMRYTTAASIKALKLTEGRDVKALPRSEQLEIMLELARVMINCAIAARNMENHTEEKLLEKDQIGLLASPEELKVIFDAMQTVNSGKNRDIKTEENAEKKESAE